MFNQDTLISLLNQSGSQSGTMLGKALGVSRVTVQKRIQSLIDNGLPISATPGRGYTLENGVQLLSADAIAAEIISVNPAHQGRFSSLEVMQSLPSTNDHLLAQETELGNMRVCVAESQQAGRGRRGNDWQSAPYRNIMLSVSWSFPNWPETITGLGLAVAQTVVELLNALLANKELVENEPVEKEPVNKEPAIRVPAANSPGIKIKWPNDLMVADDKLGGILIDVAGESSGACNVVIGLGLNVHQPDWSTDNADYRWCDLNSLGIHTDRNSLIGRIVAAWLSMLLEFEQSGFAPLTDRWNQLSSYAGKRIRVGEHDSHIKGKMLGVDSVGALLLESDDGQIHRFSESNVSVRLI